MYAYSSSDTVINRASRLVGDLTRSATVYNAAGQVASSETDYVSGAGLDASGNVVAGTIVNFQAAPISHYDINGLVVEVVNADGTKTQTVYDVMGRTILSVDRFMPGQADPIQGTRTIYDSLGRVVQTQRVSGVSVTTTQDSSGLYRITAVTGAGLTLSGSAWSIDPSFSGYLSHTQSIYDDQGRVVESISATGLRSGTIYYPNGQAHFSGVLDPAAPANWYTQSTPTNYFLLDTASGHRQYTTYAYGLTTGTLPGGAVSYDSVTDALGHVTRSYKDKLGRAFLTVFDDGSSTQNLIGVGTQPISGYVVAGQTITGHQETRIDQMGNATDRFYDASGRLTDVWLPAVADALNSGTMTRPHWHYTYDADGNEVSQVDPKGDTTTFTYDALGRRTSRRLPNTAGESTAIETWTFDALGRALSHVDFDGQTTIEVYDDSATGNGRLSKEYRFRNDSTKPALDANGAPIVANAAEETEYHYDALGRQHDVIEWVNNGGAWSRSRTERTDYDPISGEAQEVRAYDAGVDPDAPGATPISDIHYAYDETTGQHVRTWTADDDTVYAYDLQGRLQSVYEVQVADQRFATFDHWNSLTHAPVFTGGVPPTIAYSYDGDGDLTGVSDPNGYVTTYQYNDLNRLTLETIKNGTTTTETFNYNSASLPLRVDGLRAGVVDTRYNANGTVFSQTTTAWTYDALDRLIGEVLTVQTAGSDTPAAYNNQFKFDLAGNRTEEDVNGGSTNASGETVLYTYNQRDQLLTETHTNHDSTKSYTITYGQNVSGNIVNGYDANGSLIYQNRTGANPENDTYAWDLRNRLAAVSTTKSATTTLTTYAYDSSGLRVSESTKVGSGTPTNTYFVNDANNPTGYAKAVEEKTGTSAASATVSRSYVFGMKVEAQRDVADTVDGVMYLLTDAHGSTRSLINTGGTQVQHFDYDAYGTLIGSVTAATAKTSWLFAGDGILDPMTGWRDTVSRSINGFWFPERDSLITGPGDFYNANLHVYAGGNPINLNDPSGHFVGLVFGFGGLLLTAGGRFTWTVVDFSARHAPAIATATSIAGTLFFLSSIELALEQTGFLPTNKYTPYVVAISGFVFTAGQSLQAISQQTVAISTPIRGSRNGKIINGQAANAEAATLGYSKPPYMDGTIAGKGVIAPGTQLVRVSAPGALPEGAFTMLRSDVAGLSPAQIASKWSIPGALPTQYQEVTADGHAAMTGIAGTPFGGTGGGLQIQLLPPFGSASFSSPIPIPPGGVPAR